MAAALVLGACEKEEAVVDNSSISLSENIIDAAPEGSVYDIKVTSSGDWRVSGLCDWARPLAESGKSGDVLKIEVDPSDSKEILTTQFKVFSGSAVQTLTVTSNPSFVVKLVSEPEVVFKSSESSLSVKLDTNVPELESVFTGNGADWVVFKERSEAFGKVILKYDILANDTYKGRSTELILKGKGKESDRITVRQDQLDAIVTDNTKLVHEGIDAGEFSFEVRANVDFTFELPEWLTLKSNVKGSEAPDGLTPSKITLAFGAADCSQMADIDFVANNKILLQVSVKQQDPNAILFHVTDKILRQELKKKGLVISSDASTECELLGPGKTVESIALDGGWYGIDIKTIDGLGNFPELTSLSLDGVNVRTLDLSDCTKITGLSISSCNNLENVVLGSCPVTGFVLDSDNYLTSQSLTVSSDNLTSINVNCSSWYISYYEACETLDVSGCPELEDIKARREYEDYWSGSTAATLKAILVSQAQKDAIDAGSLTVDKSDITEIVVK